MKTKKSPFKLGIIIGAVCGIALTVLICNFMYNLKYNREIATFWIHVTNHTDFNFSLEVYFDEEKDELLIPSVPSEEKLISVEKTRYAHCTAPIACAVSLKCQEDENLFYEKTFCCPDYETDKKGITRILDYLSKDLDRDAAMFTLMFSINYEDGELKILPIGI